MTLDCSYRQRLGGERKPENRGRIIAFRPLFSVLRPPSAQPRAGARRRRRLLLKTSFASNTSRRPAVKQSPTTEMPLAGRRNTDDRERIRTDVPILSCRSFHHPASAECVSSSQCQRTENRGQRTDNRRLSPLSLNARRFYALCETQNLKGHQSIGETHTKSTTRDPIRPPVSVVRPPNGGARRDRTDDLMLAKHALSQLSYGPVAAKRRVNSDQSTAIRKPSPQPLLFTDHCSPIPEWWAWEDLNLRPHAYQARALTN